MDDAYILPGPGSTYFSTTTQADPVTTPIKKDPVVNPFNDLTGSWDATLDSLKTFLDGQGGGDLLFFFNNNQTGTGADINLAAWGRVWITDKDKKVVGDTYYLTNAVLNDPKAGYGGGTQSGIYGTDLGIDFGDPKQFTGSGASPLVVDPTNGRSDYVLSGSNFCVDKTTFLPAVCGVGNSSPELAHNLGTAEAAYALHFPELNARLKTLFAGSGLNQYTLHVDVRLGCQAADGSDAEATGSNGGTTHCTARSLNNGAERIFIGTGNVASTSVPEPGILALLAAALAGLGITRRRLVRQA